MSFDFFSLVTDRTQSDVTLLNNKGTYNAADMNRVTAAMDTLYGFLTGLGYAVPGYAPVYISRPEFPPGEETDHRDPYTWFVDDVPTAGQLAQYLENVQALRNVISSAQFSADLPQSMAVLTYVGANAIEQILTEINAYITAMQSVFLCSGMAWATAGSPGFYFAN